MTNSPRSRRSTGPDRPVLPPGADARRGGPAARLARGDGAEPAVRRRQRLRSRLARRGLVPAVSGLAAALSGESWAAVPRALISSTVRAATSPWAESSEAFPAAVALLEGASKAMLFVKIKSVCGAILAIGVIVSAAGVISGQSPGGPEGPARVGRPDPPKTATRPRGARARWPRPLRRIPRGGSSFSSKLGTSSSPRSTDGERTSSR